MFFDYVQNSRGPELVPKCHPGGGVGSQMACLKVMKSTLVLHQLSRIILAVPCIVIQPLQATKISLRPTKVLPEHSFSVQNDFSSCNLRGNFSMDFNTFEKHVFRTDVY